MTGFPTSFHLGPLVFHIYGFGLAIAAYVAYLYARRRLEKRDISVAPFARFTFWILVSALIGARAANIATNWSYYDGHPGRWIAVWQGGLASFGGIGLALVVGLFLWRRYWPETRLAAFTDALVPALIAGWALGRFLGPQFMVDGGGHLTHQWFGLHYHGQVGKRVPVPLIQGCEDGLLWLILDRRRTHEGKEHPRGHHVDRHDRLGNRPVHRRALVTRPRVAQRFPRRADRRPRARGGWRRHADRALAAPTCARRSWPIRRSTSGDSQRS